jgi:hypothetical protein
LGAALCANVEEPSDMVEYSDENNHNPNDNWGNSIKNDVQYYYDWVDLLADHLNADELLYEFQRCNKRRFCAILGAYKINLH